MNGSGSIAAEIVFNAIKKDSPEKIEANIPECFCPICKSAKIEISETFEDGSGMTFFLLKCTDCGSRFVLLEDLINSIRRKIENAKNIENQANKDLEKFMEVD